VRAILVVLLLLAGAALAGPDALDGHDDHGPDDGPVYWGFVKDTSGVPVRDAKVSAVHRSLTLVTRSTATGAYRLRGFKKDATPEQVTISCEKEGYRQVRVFRFPLPKGKPIKSVETECRLQKS
jgi:Carboxypeptidase regulatory-like domain